MNTSLNTTRNRKRVQGRPWRRAHRILLAGILLMCLLSTGTAAFSVRAAETDTSPEMVEFTADPASMPDDSTADDAIIAQEEEPEQTEIGEISAQETQTVLPLENGGLTESEDVSSVADGILMTALEDSVPAAEEDTTWQKDYYYTLYTGTGTIRLSQYTGNGADIVVPATATIDGVTYHTEIYEDVYSRKYSIRSVRFEDGVRAGTTLRGLFRWCFNLASVDLGNLDTSAVRDMSLMFSNCVQLRDLDLSMLDTSSVTNMSQMLINCYRLETLNVRGFNTSKVTTMWNMFSDCVHLRALDLSSFDTSNCTSMDGMFSVGLEQLTLGSNWAFRTSYAGLLGVWTDGTATYRAAELEQLAAEEVPGTYTRVSYGGVTRAADTPGQAEISLGEDYRQTAALTEADKADAAQRNGQVSDAADAAGGRLIKTVEWTDKDAGEASVGLEYAVPDLGTRAVYAFGTCNAHGFGADIAMTQILELLDQYDYVDILTSECQFWKYYYEGRDFMATSHKVQLTLSAADGRTANLQRLMALFAPDYSDVLNYNIINWGDHASGTILLRYLQDYLQERTPTAIYVACDGSRAFSNDTQPGSVETAANALYGCSRSRLIRKTYDDLQVDADTMRTLAEYQQNGRYYVCICKEEREYCVAYYDTHEDDEGSRLLCYASFALFNPDYYVNHHDELIAYLDSGERFGSRYYADFPNVGQALINYGTSFASQNIELAGVPLTMTDTVDEDLVIDEDDIAVSVTRDGIAVHDVADASVTVTGQEVRVEMPSVLTGEVVRVRIPLSLREGVTTYCSQEDGFRDTNVGDAVAAVEDYGSVSVASPRLYKGVDVEPEPEPEPAPEPEPEPEPVPEPETPDAEPEETGHETEHHRTVHHTTEEHRTVNTTVVNQTIVNPVEAVDAAIEPAATAAESANEAAAVGSEGPGPATGDDARMMRWFALFITASAALLVWIAVQVRRL